jgi:Transmembrane domain of unknown function (DUF3566)
MSDRTKSSVRTGTRTDGTDAAAAAAPDAAPATGETRAEVPVSATQSIPTGQNRVVQSGRPAAAAVPPPATGDRPVVPPATGDRPVVPPAPGDRPVVPGTGTPRAVAAGAAAPGGAAVKGKGAAAAARKATTKAGRGPRRARLQLRHIDTWSAFKISFVLSIALFFIWMVAVGVLYGVLGSLGVFGTLNELFGQLGGAGGGDVITPGVVFGAAAVIGAVNIILLTALGTVSTFIYNLCSDLVGGLEVTLSERD